MHLQSASPPKIAHSGLAGRASPPLHPEGVLPRSGAPASGSRAVVSVRHRAKAACLKVHQTGLQIGFQLIRAALRSLPSSGAIDRVREFGNWSCKHVGRPGSPLEPTHALTVNSCATRFSQVLERAGQEGCRDSDLSRAIVTHLGPDGALGVAQLAVSRPDGELAGCMHARPGSLKLAR